MESNVFLANDGVLHTRNHAVAESGYDFRMSNILAVVQAKWIGVALRVALMGLALLVFGVSPSFAVQRTGHPTKQGPSEKIIEKSPLLVQLQDTQDQVAERAAIDKLHATEARTNLFIMLFTGGAMIVGIFQVGIFLWQLRLIQKSVRTTELAANAADLNARAAVGIELPVLRVIPTDLVDTDNLIGDDNAPYGGAINDGPPRKYSAIGNIQVRNLGRTPAFPEEIFVGWMVASTLPEKPIHLKRNRLNHAAVIEPNSEFLLNNYFGIELNDAEIEAAKSDKAWLWFYGYITYTDFLNSRREARFCWRFANRNYDNISYYFSSDGEPPVAYLPVGPVELPGIDARS